MEESAVEISDSVILNALVDNHPRSPLLRQASQRSLTPSSALDAATCGPPIVAIHCAWEEGHDEVVLEDTSGRKTTYDLATITAPLVDDPSHKAIINCIRAGKLALRSEKARSTTLVPPLDPAFDTDCERSARSVLELAQHLTSDGGHYEELDRIRAACDKLLSRDPDEVLRPPTAAANCTATETSSKPAPNAAHSSIAQVIFDAANAQLQVMRTAVGYPPSLEVHKVPLSIAFLNDVIEEKSTDHRRKSHHEHRGSVSVMLPEANDVEAPDLVIAREHRALVQFALEVMDSLESNRAIISSDPMRPDPTRMLSSVRGQIIHVEETLRVQNRAISVAEQKASLHQLSEAKTLRTLLYKELEQLRGSERVLECCIAEKKKTMQSVHEERASFNKFAVDARGVVKEKQRELARLVATTSQLRKELNAVNEQLVASKDHNRSVTDELDRLRNVLNALRDKRRQGALAGTSPGKTEQSASGVPSPQRGVRAVRQQVPSKLVYDLASTSRMTRASPQEEIVDRLYTKEIDRRKAREEREWARHTPAFLSPSKVARVDVEDVNDRLYAKAKDDAKVKEKTLRAKYVVDRPASATLTQTQLAASLTRMTSDFIKERDAKRTKIFEESVLSKEKKPAKMSKEETAVTVQRLFTAKK